MNALEKYREDHHLTYRDLSARTGLPLAACHRHASGARSISAEAAVRYEAALGIPRSALRPDYWPPQEGTGSGSSLHANPIGGTPENFSSDK